MPKIIPSLKDILLLNHYAFFLIKPQFESTKEAVKKGKINHKAKPTMMLLKKSLL